MRPGGLAQSSTVSRKTMTLTYVTLTERRDVDLLDFLKDLLVR
jgi:hypothetical protein